MKKFSSLGTRLIFQEPPENFNPKVEVAACFIKAGNDFLFLKRQPHKTEGNCWGVPGGKLDKGDTPESAVLREIQEETGIQLHNQPIKYFGKVYIRYPKIDFIYHMFEHKTAIYPEVVISAQEHSEFRWITLEQALELTLIPGEDECIDLCYGINVNHIKR
jgi:8-oxo-dGTP diphosphatase